MTEYISRASLINNLITFAPEHYTSLINDLILKEPAADVRHVVRGRWLHKETTDNFHVVGQCSVCKEWADPYCGFVSFVKWAKYHGYEEQLSIDRINNDKGYYPSNCRWVDWNVQANNRRKPTMITNQYGKWPYKDMPLPEPPKEE